MVIINVLFKFNGYIGICFLFSVDNIINVYWYMILGYKINLCIYIICNWY